MLKRVMVAMVRPLTHAGNSSGGLRFECELRCSNNVYSSDVYFRCEKETRRVVESKSESQTRVVVMSDRYAFKKSTHISVHVNEYSAFEIMQCDRITYMVFAFKLKCFLGATAQDDLINDSTSQKWMLFMTQKRSFQRNVRSFLDVCPKYLAHAHTKANPNERPRFD